MMLFQEGMGCMPAIVAGRLWVISLILYLIAALMALILSDKPRTGNIVTHLICMLAAGAGAAGSLVQLLAGSGPVFILAAELPVPLMSIDLSVDYLSAFFLLILSVLVICVSLYSIGYLRHYYGKRPVGLFNFLYTTFIVSMVLVFTAGNAVFFLIAWEAMSVLSYFLVIFESEQEANQRAGSIYLIMTSLGTAFLLTAFLIMFRYTGTLNLAASSAAIPLPARNGLFLLFLIGFGLKAGIVPLHIWLPYAHPSAPSPVSALMSGIMIKTALYGLLRFVLIYLGVQQTWWGLALLLAGLFSAVIGVAYAAAESNIKKLLAYSSIENIGIIFIGLGAGFYALALKRPALAALALGAALFHALNHAFFKGGLFLGAGSIQYATGTKNMDELGGLIKRMPTTALFVLGGALSISALPPFNGFMSEWLTIQAIFHSLTAATTGVSIVLILTLAGLALAGALAAACFMKFYGIVFLGRPRSAPADAAHEVPHTMRFGMGFLVALCLVFGLAPAIFIRLTDRLIVNLTGQSLTGQLTGWLVAGQEGPDSATALSSAAAALSPAAAPVPASLSPAAILILLVLLLAGLLLVLRLVGGKLIVRKYGSWDCGYEVLNARMQYTAAGFAKPFKIVFRILFRPVRTLTVKGSLHYHPEEISYSVTTESLFEKYLYSPIVRLVKALSLKAKQHIQTGSIRRYLAYLLLALLATMLYNRIF